MASEAESVDLPTGVTLQYVEQGDPDGVPVVFLHGLSDSWRSFELVLSQLPVSIHALVPSQRGHGDSSRPGAAYRWQDFSADVEAFLDALGLEAAVLVGHSMGATIAQRFAIDHPGRTRGLVLIDAFASLAASDAPRELWSALSGMEEGMDRDVVREFQESTLAQPVPPSFFEAIVQESLKLPLDVWKAVVKCTMQDDFSDELDRIEAPTLLFWGDRDTMVSRSDQETLLAAIARSRLEVYSGAGHALHWEEPERFAADLVNFIETDVT